MRTNHYFLIIVLISLASSCTIQKRTFNSGYYVTWNKKHFNQGTKNSENSSNSLAENIPQTGAPNQGDLLLSNHAVAVEYNSNELNASDQTPTNSSYELESNAPVMVEDRLNSCEQQSNKSDSEILSANEPFEKSSKAKTSGSNGGKLQIVALILCILLGLIGVHRFYLGYTGLGVLYLLTLGLFGIGWIIDIILLIIPNGLTPKGRNNYKE